LILYESLMILLTGTRRAIARLQRGRARAAA
jgi:hypothetical protein